MKFYHLIVLGLVFAESSFSFGAVNPTISEEPNILKIQQLTQENEALRRELSDFQKENAALKLENLEKDQRVSEYLKIILELQQKERFHRSRSFVDYSTLESSDESSTNEATDERNEPRDSDFSNPENSEDITKLKTRPRSKSF